MATQVLVGAAGGGLAALGALRFGSPDTLAEGVVASPWIVLGVAGVAALGGVVVRRLRLVRWLLVVWVLLCAGRAGNVAFASFLLDIVAPMPDGVFLDRAVPSLMLAAALLTGLAWADLPRLRYAVAAFALAQAIIVLTTPPTLGTAESADDLMSDGSGEHATSLGLPPGAKFSRG